MAKTSYINEVWLLNAKGEASLGKIALSFTADYKTNGTEKKVTDSVIHGNACLHDAAIPKDSKTYPALQFYQLGSDKPHAVTYVSSRDLPASQWVEVEQWLIAIMKNANLFTEVENAGPNYLQKILYLT